MDEAAMTRNINAHDIRITIDGETVGNIGGRASMVSPNIEINYLEDGTVDMPPRPQLSWEEHAARIRRTFAPRTVHGVLRFIRGHESPVGTYHYSSGAGITFEDFNTASNNRIAHQQHRPAGFSHEEWDRQHNPDSPAAAIMAPAMGADVWGGLNRRNPYEQMQRAGYFNLPPAEPRIGISFNVTAGALIDEADGFQSGPTEMTLDQKNQYVQTLCVQTGRNFSEIDLSPFAACTSKSEINKLFFTGEAPVINTEISDSLTLRAGELFKNVNESIAYKREMNRFRRSAQSAQDLFQQDIARMVEFRRKLNLSDQRDGNFYVDALKNIIGKGRWKFVDATASSLRFILTNDCIIKWKDDRKSIDMTVNFGKFILNYNVRENRIRIDCGENNLNYGGHMHPHINLNGAVCWGNAQETITKALESFDTEKITETVFLLLHEYNDESPYISLNVFKDIENQIQVGITAFFKYHIEDDIPIGDFDVENYEDDNRIYYIVKLMMFKDKETGQLTVEIEGDRYDVEESWICHADPELNKFPPADEETDDDDDDESGG